MLKPRTRGIWRHPRGLSIVELMVGIAIGLFVVAAASMLVATQLSDNRRLTLETQVQQDLRATADIITRELRRAGHWAQARHSVGDPATTNPNTGVTVEDGTPFPEGQPLSAVLLSYSRSGDEADMDVVELGFGLSNGVVQTQLGDAPWQALTDANTLNVTEFTVTMNRQPIPLECPKPCPDPSVECRPILEVRDLTVFIKGRAAHDASVERSIRSNVRLRNDTVVAGTCPA
jgi:hypothetical protein